MKMKETKWKYAKEINTVKTVAIAAAAAPFFGALLNGCKTAYVPKNEQNTVVRPSAGGQGKIISIGTDIKDLTDYQPSDKILNHLFPNGRITNGVGIRTELMQDVGGIFGDTAKNIYSGLVVSEKGLIQIATKESNTNGDGAKVRAILLPDGTEMLSRDNNKTFYLRQDAEAIKNMYMLECNKDGLAFVTTEKKGYALNWYPSTKDYYVKFYFGETPESGAKLIVGDKEVQLLNGTTPIAVGRIYENAMEKPETKIATYNYVYKTQSASKEGYEIGGRGVFDPIEGANVTASIFGKVGITNFDRTDVVCGGYDITPKTELANALDSAKNARVFYVVTEKGILGTNYGVKGEMNNYAVNNGKEAKNTSVVSISKTTDFTPPTAWLNGYFSAAKTDGKTATVQTNLAFEYKQDVVSTSVPDFKVGKIANSETKDKNGVEVVAYAPNKQIIVKYCIADTPEYSRVFLVNNLLKNEKK
ncbi:MAG: hypothetical protein NT051_02260 [Candidatus Micrarchaeota archaeon]|nr:hypothetical protein [Candidatus Micrarchaeota archaeon]